MNDPWTKDLCITREQSIGIHDNAVNDQGFAMHYRAISNTFSHLQVFRCERILHSKAKGYIAFFSHVEHSKSKDL